MDSTVTISKHEGVWDRGYVEELEADRKRLEWLIAHDARVIVRNGCFVVIDWDGNQWSQTEGNDWLDAIDEAMEATNG